MNGRGHCLGNVKSTRSPSLSWAAGAPASLALDLIVRLLSLWAPSGVTRLALFVDVVISAVIVVWRPTAPPGLAPGALRVAAVSVLTSGGA